MKKKQKKTQYQLFELGEQLLFHSFHCLLIKCSIYAHCRWVNRISLYENLASKYVQLHHVCAVCDCLPLSRSLPICLSVCSFVSRISNEMIGCAPSVVGNARVELLFQLNSPLEAHSQQIVWQMLTYLIYRDICKFFGCTNNFK